MKNDGYEKAHSLVIRSGEKLALCRCWKSRKFPLCDGSHRDIGQECGSPVGPVIVTVDDGTSSIE